MSNLPMTQKLRLPSAAHRLCSSASTLEPRRSEVGSSSALWHSLALELAVVPR